jgi:rubrerythrin
MHNSNKAA